MSIYQNVKTRAKSMELPISEIEKRAGIANGTIGGWRTGKPFAETLQKVARVLGCTIEDLLNTEEESQ